MFFFNKSLSLLGNSILFSKYLSNISQFYKGGNLESKILYLWIGLSLAVWEAELISKLLESPTEM